MPLNDSQRAAWLRRLRAVEQEVADLRRELDEAQLAYAAAPPAAPLDVAYSVAEVAERLQVSPTTVYGLIRAGRLRSKRLGYQRPIRVPASALAAFLEESD
jgi:excisionase family DNA binding protein